MDFNIGASDHPFFTRTITLRPLKESCACLTIPVLAPYAKVLSHFDLVKVYIKKKREIHCPKILNGIF